MNVPGKIEVSVLGPLEARRDGVPVSVPGAKPRAVLTMLGLSAGRPVAAEVLAAALWGDRPPRTAAKALQTHVSVLRRALGPVILTRGPGWVLSVGSSDAARFLTAAQAGRQALQTGDPATALRHLGLASEMWRGAPELPPTPRAQAEVTRWLEVYESLVEDAIDARLATGYAAELIGELEAAVVKAPLRERRWAQLALALYRTGRQGDALRAYQRARAVLADELGVEPGAELRRLELAMLAHDPRLDAGTVASAQPVRPEPAALPAPPTTFVGRADEFAMLGRLAGVHPLVTVTGPGGVGKTRLALAVADAAADAFPGGAVFVDLVPVTAHLVTQAVATALAVTEHPRQPLEDAIHERLRQARTMLILDSCEHVVDGVGRFVSRLAQACPEAAVLATSRERLGLSGEHIFAVPPMSLVGPGTGGPKGSDAETLFLDRVRAADPEFDDDSQLIGEVCRQLDGIPLAIELAAARCASLGIDGLIAGLDDRLSLLTGARGTDDRHRSLRAVLDWSHDLLDPEERAVFRALGVFVGGFDLATAAAVTGVPSARLADLIGRLTDKSLLVHERHGTGSRWRQLEVVRTYARERLAGSGDEPAIGDRYLKWAAGTAISLESRLHRGEPWQEAFHQVADDLRAAVLGAPEHSEGKQQPAEKRLPLALALAHLYSRCGAFTAAQLGYESAMTMARASGDAAHLAQAALGASAPGMLFGVTQRGRVALLEEALTAQPAEPTGTQVQLMARLATELYWSADRTRSLELTGRAMATAERLSDDKALAHALYARHYVTRRAGEMTGRLALADRLIAAARRAGIAQLELAGLAARVAGLLERADVWGVDAELDGLARRADQLGHPEFQWYAAVYRVVRALIDGRFDEADELAATAQAEAANHAPELSVGLYFAQVVTDLRPPDDDGSRPRFTRLGEMVAQFPRVFVWRCAALGEDVRVAAAAASPLRYELLARARSLADELDGQPVPDGHWLVGSCVLAEAVAQLGDDELASRLAGALRPYADGVAVAGRVAAFRGSVAHPLGLLALATGDAETAVSDLSRAADLHAHMGARPFHARSLAALAVALDARRAAGDHELAAATRRRAAELADRPGIGRYRP